MAKPESGKMQNREFPNPAFLAGFGGKSRSAFCGQTGFYGNKGQWVTV